MRAPPTSAAMISPRSRIKRNSFVSPAPSDCVVKATVLMRRKANSQNMQSNSTDAIATPPSSVASPSRPIAVVETMPISGVVRFATIAGPAMAKTCLVVTFERGLGACMDYGPTTAPAPNAAADGSQLFRLKPCNESLSAARRAEQARQQPDRDHDHGAEQEVAPQPVDRVEAEVPQPLEQQTDAGEDIPGVEADRGEYDADQDRQQDQPERDRKRRATEKAVQAVMMAGWQVSDVVLHRFLLAD